MKLREGSWKIRANDSTLGEGKTVVLAWANAAYRMANTEAVSSIVEQYGKTLEVLGD